MAEQLDRFHCVSYLLGALTHASEKILGQYSRSICILAGRRFSREDIEAPEQTDDPEKAVEILRKAFNERGIVWDFAPFKGERENLIEKRDGAEVMRLVFRTCMVRNALFRNAHEQKESMCYMSHGVFTGAMEKVMPGRKVNLEVLHAGPNACLKEMILVDV